MKDVTVITGGAGGMGIACAKIMGKTSKLLLVDVSDDSLARAVGVLAEEGITDIETTVCDVTNRWDVDNLAELASSLGNIKTVFNLAGVSPATAEAELIIAVNAIGVYNMIEAFFPVMGEGSNMVTVNSLATHLFKKHNASDEVNEIMDHPEAPGFYDTLLEMANTNAKAIDSLPKYQAYPISKYFSYRYSRRNVRRFWSRVIRINTVTPGTIATPMGIAEAAGNARMQQGMAIDRDGTPDEMAAAICFLASDEAADITGIDLPVDGGWTCIAEFPQIEA